MNKESKRKTLFWILIFATFVILIIGWQLYLKILPQQKVEKNEIFEKIKTGGFGIKENFERFFEEIRDLKISNLEEGSKENQEELTGEKIEKLKEKVLEYVNKKE